VGPRVIAKRVILEAREHSTHKTCSLYTSHPHGVVSGQN
jgi:hypothetical protein